MIDSPMNTFTRVRAKRGIVAAIVLALCGQATNPAFGWGARGHRVAARVAMARLSPAAAAAVRELLNQGDTLVDIANWADHEGFDVVPRSGPWHYVNVPITASRYDDRYCRQEGCVVSRIRESRKILANRNAPRRERQLALLFLVHFVEDIHQPLHVGDHGDRGGNQTQVQFFGEGTNLHHLWDSGVIERAGGDERAWIAQVTRLITQEKVQEWSKGDETDWANESLAAARRAYRFPNATSPPIASGARLGDDYLAFATPVVRERLAQAGVRLANELNALFR